MAGRAGILAGERRRGYCGGSPRRSVRRRQDRGPPTRGNGPKPGPDHGRRLVRLRWRGAPSLSSWRSDAPLGFLGPHSVAPLAARVGRSRRRRRRGPGDACASTPASGTRRSPSCRRRCSPGPRPGPRRGTRRCSSPACSALISHRWTAAIRSSSGTTRSIASGRGSWTTPARWCTRSWSWDSMSTSTRPRRPSASCERLGFDLSRVHETSWQGAPAYVVGALAGDTTSRQFWVEKDRLLFVRMLEPVPDGSGKMVETQFNRYQPLGRGWIAVEVLFNIGGETVTSEAYADVRQGMTLPPGLFDPVGLRASGLGRRPVAHPPRGPRKSVPAPGGPGPRSRGCAVPPLASGAAARCSAGPGTSRRTAPAASPAGRPAAPPSPSSTYQTTSCADGSVPRRRRSPTGGWAARRSRV